MYVRALILLFLLASPLLASPTEVQLSRPPSPPGPSREWICFSQRYPYRPLRMVYSADCESALKQIETSDKAGAPMLISRTAGYIVPHPLNVGTCGILLDINDRTADKTVTVPMMVIVRAIRFILAMCVSDPPPPGLALGGFTEIHSPDESGGILDVVVVGRYSPPEDPPPYPQAAPSFDRPEELSNRGMSFKI